MKTKHTNFTRKTAFGSVAIPMFGARVVNGLFRKTEKNQSSLTLLTPFWIVGVLALGLLAGSHTAMGAVDTGDEPLCGDDNICNIAVCNNDPDCSDVDLPNNGSDGGSNGSGGSSTPSSWDEADIDTDLVRITDNGIDFGDNTLFIGGAPVGFGSVVWSIVDGFYTPRLIGGFHLAGVSGQYGRMHISYWDGSGEHIDTRHSRTRFAPDNDHYAWPVDVSPVNLRQITEVHVCTEISDDGIDWEQVTCTTKYLD